MKDGEIFQADNAPEPVGTYPHARKDGSLIFLSGIGPRPAGGGPIPGVTPDDAGKIVAYDIAAQCHAVFANVRPVLESAAARWDSLADVTVRMSETTEIQRCSHSHRSISGNGSMIIVTC